DALLQRPLPRHPPQMNRECSAMTRVLLAAALLAVCRAGAAEVPLSVQPRAAPKPALKYLLLPEVKELKPGNPVQWYIRCFQEQRNFFFSKAATAERARYQAMP